MQLCLRYTKNEQDARAVLNAGFLKVFVNIQRYDPAQSTLYTWMRTVVVNTCIDFVKKQAKAEKYSELEEAADIQIDGAAISNMEAAQLLYFIRKLPHTTQVVFNLYVIEGYSHKEIAKLMTISEGTSKWYLSEARKKLQHMIKSKEVNI